MRLLQEWTDAPRYFSFDNVFVPGRDAVENPTSNLSETEVVAIIYTSGTSGEAKGVMLNAGNVGHMLGCTSGRLTQLMKRHLTMKQAGQDPSSTICLFALPAPGSC